MNYRDYNPNASCLPAEAYPYLALALGQAKSPCPTLFGRIQGIIWRIFAAIPLVALTAAFLPLADPPPEHLIPLSELATPDHTSLIWVEPKEKSKPLPETMPRLVRISI